MANLSEIYSKVENPMDNNEILQKLIGQYSKAERGDKGNSGGLYKNLVKFNGNKDTTGVSVSDKEKFYVETYNQWKNKLLSLTPEQKQEQKKIGVDVENLISYLKSFGEIRTMEDVERLRQNPLLEKEMNGWELEDGWSHIKSRYINLRQESSIQVKHRLYLGCQNQDIFKVANLFKSKCQERGIPYYFKFASNGERDDKIVVYSDTENLSNYIDILGQIAKQNPEIKNRAGNPPALTGKIDGWIGIADEPPVDAKGDNHSFNEIRARIIEDSVEKELLRSIRDLKGKNVNYGGKKCKI